ncbi:MAG: hypothetical protein HYV47_01065 [Candidatus Nealsonbacteria bacterium]|nr:hypothetical protein [Candidatus Nealsonbacteria bacterium]
MRKLGAAVYLLFIILLIAFTGCGPSTLKPPVELEPGEQQYDMSVVQTIGNRSYIPLNISGNPSEHISTILGVLTAFENAHPELEIVSWYIEKQQKAYITSNYIFGIWVDHRLRKD